MPCSNNEIQAVQLGLGYPWRFFSPRFPSTLGYPHDATCTWHFVVDPVQVESVSVACDHLDIEGNFFNECDDADYLLIRHENDFDEIHAPGRLCGDLTSWVPMNSTINLSMDHGEETQK